ncbi:MAG: hypothetical protein ACPG5N_06995 [Planktomarina sp.]|uniref:hypothetical protein n=1 Tax=Planktomarina sp. TaxID=2024851 RepID=UPI003C3AB66E
MRDISSIAEFRDFMRNLPGADDSAGQAAAERNGQLTKPPGASVGWHSTQVPSHITTRTDTYHHAD